MITWENRFSVNVSKIDEEHKFFILIVNKIFAGKEKDNRQEQISDALNEMTEYAISHFKSEEECMLGLDYSEYREHKKEHTEFLKTTISFCKRAVAKETDLMGDICEYLEQWLVRHIQVTDNKLTECFNKNGLV